MTSRKEKEKQVDKKAKLFLQEIQNINAAVSLYFANLTSN